MARDNLPQMDYLGNGGYNALAELMRAIILRTIEDYQSRGEFYDEAVEYLTSEEDDDEYIFSFKAICRHLGYDPEKTRQSIMNATDRISTRRRAA